MYPVFSSEFNELTHWAFPHLRYPDKSQSNRHARRYSFGEIWQLLKDGYLENTRPELLGLEPRLSAQGLQLIQDYSTIPLTDLEWSGEIGTGFFPSTPASYYPIFNFILLFGQTGLYSKTQQQSANNIAAYRLLGLIELTKPVPLSEQHHWINWRISSRGQDLIKWAIPEYALYFCQENMLPSAISDFNYYDFLVQHLPKKMAPELLTQIDARYAKNLSEAWRRLSGGNDDTVVPTHDDNVQCDNDHSNHNIE